MADKVERQAAIGEAKQQVVSELCDEASEDAEAMLCGLERTAALQQGGQTRAV